MESTCRLQIIQAMKVLSGAPGYRAVSGILQVSEALKGGACLSQVFDADLMLGEVFYSCTALLASRMDIPWVSYFAAAPLEPFLTSIWSGGNRRAFTPNPLSYFPQISMSTTTQFMVSLLALLQSAPGILPHSICHDFQCSPAAEFTLPVLSHLQTGFEYSV